MNCPLKPVEFASLPLEIQDFTVRSARFAIPDTAAALSKIEFVHKRYLRTGWADGLLLTGPPGCGKTTAIRLYTARYPSVEEKHRTHIPVAHVSVPETPTLKAFNRAFLVAMGDPAASIGGADEKREHIEKDLINCGTELVLIDEIHHWLEATTVKEATGFLNGLKKLFETVKIPYVGIGQPTAEALIAADKQIRRRFHLRCTVTPFRFETPAQFKVARGILKQFWGLLPIDSIPFHDANVARRFIVGTHGVIDYIAAIVDMAVLIGASQDPRRIDLPVLGAAFREVVWADAPDNLNPFLTTLELRPLTERGEPFEGWEDHRGYVGKSLAEVFRIFARR